MHLCICMCVHMCMFIHAHIEGLECKGVKSKKVSFEKTEKMSIEFLILALFNKKIYHWIQHIFFYLTVF